MPAATTSTTRGPAAPEETMPSVKTDDPEIPSAVAKSTPAAYHSMSASPSTMRQSQMMKRSTMAAGPTNEKTRSRVSYFGSVGAIRRAEQPRARASMRMAGEEVARGTTSAVNTLQAVRSTMAMPAM